MTRRNPFVGTHPDLLPLSQQYPPGTKLKKLSPVPGETPVFVPVGELSSRQLRELPRDAFSLEEWVEQLNDRDRDAIIEMDTDSQDRVDALAKIFIDRWSWESDHQHRDFSHVEDSFEYHLRERAGRLWEEMDDSVRDELVTDGAALGIPEPRVLQLIDAQLQDTNNFDFNPAERATRGRAVYWSESIEGNVYVEKGDWEDEIEHMHPDEIERAIDKMKEETHGTIDIDYDFFEKAASNRYATYEHTWDTRDMFNVYAKWDRIVEGVRDAFTEEEIDDAFDPVGAAPPEERVVHRWPDGFYVLDLLPSELPLEGKTQGMCVGRPDMGYGLAIRNNEIKILSLRRPSGKPLFTFEASITKRGGKDHFDITEFDQIRGKGNRVPGFDLGQDRYLTSWASGRYLLGRHVAELSLHRPVGLERSENKFAIMAAARAIKRDEVQRVIDYVKSTPAPITAGDLLPALTAIALLSIEGDKWANDIVSKSKTLQQAITDDRHVLEGIVSGSVSQLSSKDPGPKENPGSCGVHGSQCIGFCKPYQRKPRRNWR